MGGPHLSFSEQQTRRRASGRERKIQSLGDEATARLGWCWWWLWCLAAILVDRVLVATGKRNPRASVFGSASTSTSGSNPACRRLPTEPDTTKTAKHGCCSFRCVELRSACHNVPSHLALGPMSPFRLRLLPSCQMQVPKLFRCRSLELHMSTGMI